MAVPSKPIPVAEPDLGEAEERLLLDAFRSGWISSHGEYVTRFEREFSQLCGGRHGIAVANGTVALQLALLACRVGEGDEVIVPTLSFVATAAAVRHVQAVPVFCDCEPGIGTIDPSRIEELVSPRTKAIVVVHLYGHPVDMDPVMEVAARHGLIVIEDAAEAHGARYKGRPVGGIGHIGAFSFYGNKIITTGEGGMLVTDRDDLASTARFLKDHAMDPARRYWHPEVGYNFRMTNMQAAVGCGQMQRFDEIIERRARVLTWYRAEFAGINGVSINPFRSWAEPVPWLICLVLPEGTREEERNRLMSRLKSAGIDTRPYFHLISDMEPYVRFAGGGDPGRAFPVSRDLSARGMNLPSSPRLDLDTVRRVRDEFLNACQYAS
jgi:perosamine synthetase